MSSSPCPSICSGVLVYPHAFQALSDAVLPISCSLGLMRCTTLSSAVLQHRGGHLHTGSSWGFAPCDANVLHVSAHRRLMQTELMKMTCSKWELPWAVNWSTVQPGSGRLAACVGDDPQALLLDASTGQQVAALDGHIDFSFAAAWHPAGNLLATGNQVCKKSHSRLALHVHMGPFTPSRS